MKNNYKKIMALAAFSMLITSCTPFVPHIDEPDNPTDKPTIINPTDTPTDVSKPTDINTDTPTEAPTVSPTETPTEVPTETPTETPTEAPTEVPTVTPTDKPTEVPTEKPTEKPTETPTESPTEKPVESNYKKLKFADQHFNVMDLKRGNFVSSLPTKGKPKVLVLPVEFSDLPKFTNEELKTYNETFNGSNPDGTTDYWESVSSYYYKSSYGQLDMDFVMCDKFTPTITSQTFRDLEGDKTATELARGPRTIINEAVKDLKVNGVKVNYNDYDLDNDGCVDAIWLFYNEKDPEKGKSYWPYVFWANSYGETPAGNNKEISAFANCSSAFFYEASKKGLDPHTFIHETGHLLGAEDYYTYDNEGSSPNIGFDMMDLNIGDHNAYTKFIYGWLEPAVVTGDVTYNLKPLANNGDALVIPLGYWNDTAFSEYIIAEYFIPEYNNELDSTVRYVNRPYLIDEPRVSLHYIDSRILEVEPGNVFHVMDETSTELSPEHAYILGPSNSKTRCLFNQYLMEGEFFHCSLIAKGLDANPYYINNFPEYSYYDPYTLKANNDIMWGQGDVFNVNDYMGMFKDGKSQTGAKLNFTISIDEITPDNAKITVHYN